MNSSAVRGGFLFLASTGLFMALWVGLVQPVPDKDAILQLFYPVLNYLKGSQVLGFKHFLLREEFFTDAYPDGSALMAAFISLIGMQSAILEEPYWLVTFLLVPFAFLGPFKKKDILSALLLFFLPATQILLKGLSPHAFNVVYSFAGILFFLAYLRRPKRAYFALAVCCLWISMVFKHMGVLHYLTFLMSYAIWQCTYRFRSKEENLLLWILPLAAIPLYPWEASLEYLRTTLSHAPFIFSGQYLALSILAIGGAGALGILVYKKLETSADPAIQKKESRLLGSVFFPLVLILGPFVLWTFPSSESQSFPRAILVLITGYGFTLFLLARSKIAGLRGFLLLLCMLTITHHLSLYVSWIAKSSYLFFLPQLLFTWAWLTHNPGKYLKVLVLCGLILLSNFFPSLNSIEESQLFQSLASIYFEGFKSSHQNPLGWKSSRIRDIRNSITSVLQERGIRGPTLYSHEGLHFHTRLSLSFPRNIIHEFSELTALDSLSQNDALELAELWRKKGEKLFEDWVRSGKVGVLLVGVDPFTKREPEIFHLKQVIAREEFHPNRFLQALNAEFLNYLRSPGKNLDPYRETPLNLPGVKLSLWIHPILSQSQRATSLENWLEVIKNPGDPGREKSAPKRSAELFLQSNSFFESNPKKCLELLNEALSLDPENEEARTDRNIILQRLKREGI